MGLFNPLLYAHYNPIKEVFAVMLPLLPMEKEQASLSYLFVNGV